MKKSLFQRSANPAATRASVRGRCEAVLRRSLNGLDNHGVTDTFYYSAVVYTSLGFGDITPTRALRFFTAFETLTGLVLVAWTASFSFLVMQKYWVGYFKDKE